jgi:predicted ATPase
MASDVSLAVALVGAIGSGRTTIARGLAGRAGFANIHIGRSISGLLLGLPARGEVQRRWTDRLYHHAGLNWIHSGDRLRGWRPMLETEFHWPDAPASLS